MDNGQIRPIIRFVKTHELAQLPQCKRKDVFVGDSGYDIYCVEPAIIPPHSGEVVAVGLTVAYITPGFWFRIEARSGMGFKHGIAPHPGIIDNSYRGDLAVRLNNLSNAPYYVKAGDRIAQLVVYPLIQPVVGWSDEIESTERGDKGIGSSGK